MTWWPVAWSEEVARKPVPVRIGAEALVLFRDRAGTAFAFEDRCPHRRVPLSLGRVTDEGALQCGYHGWTYEGSSGRCVAIPNFRPDEAISSRIMVRTYPAAEVRRTLFVWASESKNAPAPAPVLAELRDLTIHSAGTTTVRLAYGAWIETLLADPARALGLRDEVSLSSHGSVSEFTLLDRWDRRLSIVVASVPQSAQETRVRWKILAPESRSPFARVRHLWTGRRTLSPAQESF